MGFSLGEWWVISSEPSVSVVTVTKDSLAQSSRSMSAGCVFDRYYHSWEPRWPMQELWVKLVSRDQPTASSWLDFSLTNIPGKQSSSLSLFFSPPKCRKWMIDVFFSHWELCVRALLSTLGLQSSHNNSNPTSLFLELRFSSLAVSTSLTGVLLAPEMALENQVYWNLLKTCNCSPSWHINLSCLRNAIVLFLFPDSFNDDWLSFDT